MSDDQELETVVKLVLLGDSRAADDFLKRFRRQTAAIARLEGENALMRKLLMTATSFIDARAASAYDYSLASSIRSALASLASDEAKA